MGWTIEYYSQAVEEWVMDMPDGILGHYIGITKRMSQHGPNIGMPFVRPMGGELFEIRARGPEGHGRVFYCTVQGNTIIMLHGFIKKMQTTPRREIEVARRRLKEVKDERNRKGR